MKTTKYTLSMLLNNLSGNRSSDGEFITVRSEQDVQDCQDEHAALCAVAEAAQKVSAAHVSDAGEIETGRIIAHDLINSLAQLAAVRIEPETPYRKSIRTGIKPAIWPPITMTQDDLNHFRATHHIPSPAI